MNIELFEKILNKATSLREAIDAYKELTQQAPVTEKATRKGVHGVSHALQPWTKEAERQALELWNMGMSANKIGKRLGRSKSSVRNKLSDLKATPREIHPNQRAAFMRGRAGGKRRHVDESVLRVIS